MGKEFILYAISNNAVAPLKKQYIGFGDTTVLAMIDHLHLKTAIRMTTAQKYEYNTRVQHSLGPNNKHHSILYATQLLPSLARQLRNRDKQQREDNGSGSADVAIGDVHRGPNGSLGEQGRNGANVGGIPNILHGKVAGAKAVLDVYGKTIVKEAALLAQETPAIKEEGETQAMLLFAMLQDQHVKQITQMEATNKTNLDAMMEQMNALVAAGGAQQAHQPDKENTPPGRNVIPLGGGDRVSKPR